MTHPCERSARGRPTAILRVMDLNHLNLRVRDPGECRDFYKRNFGLRLAFEAESATSCGTRMASSGLTLPVRRHLLPLAPSGAARSHDRTRSQRRRLPSSGVRAGHRAGGAVHDRPAAGCLSVSRAFAAGPGLGARDCAHDRVSPGEPGTQATGPGVVNRARPPATSVVCCTHALAPQRQRVEAAELGVSSRGALAKENTRVGVLLSTPSFHALCPPHHAPERVCCSPGLQCGHNGNRYPDLDFCGAIAQSVRAHP